MNYYTIPSLFSLCGAIFLGAFVYFRNPSSMRHRIFLLLAALTGLHALVELGYFQSRTAEDALAWQSVDVLWPLLTAALFYFVLVLTQSRWLKSGRIGVAVIGGALLFLLVDITLPASDFPRRGIGWFFSADDSRPFSVLSFVWAALVHLASMVVLYLHHRDQTSEKVRRQMALIALIPTGALLKVLLEGIYFYADLREIYPGSLFTPALLVIVTYAMVRFDLFETTPSTAAETIMRIMADGVLLVYPDLTVASCNQTLLDLLKRTRDEVKDQSVTRFFTPGKREQEWFEGLQRTVRAQGRYAPLETDLLTVHGVEISVSLIGSVLCDKIGRNIGYVIIVRDITDRIERDSELDRYRYHLEQLVEDRMGDLATANRELESSSRQLQLLSERLANAKEEESIRISKALQNDLGQILTGIKIEIELLNKKLRREGSNEHEKRTSGIIHLVDTAIKSIQKITRGLRPLMLDEIGLAASIESSISDFRRRYGIECVFENKLVEDTYDSDLSIVIYRIIQESLTNIARHSKATVAKVIATDTGDSLQVSILDDGVGIDESELTSVESVGILGMIERARAIGGNLNIFKGEKRGTRIDVAVPIRR